MSLPSYTQTAMSPSARSAVTGVPSRVLLVHANPFQRVTPVPAYGLERLRTAIEPTGAEVELIDPYLVADDPLVPTSGGERFRPDVIGLGIRIIDDCIVVDRLDGPDDEPIDVSFLLPEILELRRALSEAAPDALVLAGAGFSACPQECLEYLDVEYGVVGAGEDALAALCRDSRSGQTPGVVRRGEAEGSRLPPRLRRSDDPRSALCPGELVPGAHADRLRHAMRLLHGGESRATPRER